MMKTSQSYVERFRSTLLCVIACCALFCVVPYQAHAQTASPAPSPATFRLRLPACIADGRCTLGDIVMTGVSFANLLMGLSGAFFFATFIYGGGAYVLSFGRSEWVKKGTQAMKSAAFGMLIVMSAWTIVNYVVTSLVDSF